VVDSRRIHVGEAAGGRILQSLDDGPGLRVGRAEEVPHQALEPDIVDGPLGQVLAIEVDQLGRRPRFLGGDSEIRAGIVGGDDDGGPF
jgi:hypothetical protein